MIGGNALLLKADPYKRNAVSNNLKSVLNNLDDVEISKAVNLSKWFIEKSNYYKKFDNGLLFQQPPKDMKRGDIVLVQLGMNISPELGDDNTGKHFCMIWKQQGHNFIVIPLTKHPQNKNILSADLGIIPNMPGGVHTYAKIDAIRSVSLRRLFRIISVPDGKIETDQTLQDKISAVILKELV